MHYGVLDTACKITPIENVACRIKDQDVTEIGQRLGLSELDVTAINQHYNCDGKYCCFHIKEVIALGNFFYQLVLCSYIWNWYFCKGSTPEPCLDVGCGYTQCDQWTCATCNVSSHNLEKSQCCEKFPDTFCGDPVLKYFCSKTCGLCTTTPSGTAIIPLLIRWSIV